MYGLGRFPATLYRIPRKQSPCLTPPRLASPGLPRAEKGRNPELIQSVYAFRDAQVLARIVVRS